MKRTMRLAPIILLAMILLASFAYARSVPDLLSGGLVEINNFFTGGNYRAYAKAIDFFFFALLFIAIYLMGAKYAFKEVKNPEKAIVVLLGLMTAFLLVLGDFSATMLIPWIHWLFYLLLFFFYWWLYKGIENKFWRFLLALLSTILTIMLMQGLLNWANPEVPNVDLPGVPSVKGGFFKDFFGSFKGIKLPGVSMPGFPDYAKDWFGVPRTTITTTTGGTDTITEVVTPGPGITPGTGGGPGTTPPGTTPPSGGWWPGYDFEWKDLWPLLLLLPLLLYLFRNKLKNAWGKWKNRDRGQPVDKSDKDARTLREIMAEIEQIIALKQSVLAKLREIMKRKKAASLAFWELYHKKISHPAFLADPESQEHQNLINENDAVSQLLKLELELEAELIKLRRIEERLNNEYTGEAVNDRGEVEKDRKGRPIIIRKKPKLVQWSEQLSEIYAKSPQAMSAAPDWYMESVGTAFGILIRLYGREFFRRFTGQGIVERIFGALEVLRAGTWRLIAGGPVDRLTGRQVLAKIIGEIGIVEEVKEAIALLFLITKNAAEREKKLKGLLDLNSLEYWLFKQEGRYEKWIELQQLSANELRDFWQQQERAFLENIHDFDMTDPQNPKFQFDPRGRVMLKSAGLLVPVINEQMRHLQMLLKILQFLESERKSLTLLQELNVAVRNTIDPAKWDDIDPVRIDDVTKAYNIAGKTINKVKADVRFYEIDQRPIKIFTNFAEGIPPFNVICYVDGRKANAVWDPNLAQNSYTVPPLVASSKYPASAADEPVVRFYSTRGEFPREMEIGPLAIGRHEITVIAISPKDTFKRRSEKTIVVDILPPVSTLNLTPTNSTPVNPAHVIPIVIVGAHHGANRPFNIGKGSHGQFNHIELMDTSVHPGYPDPEKNKRPGADSKRQLERDTAPNRPQVYFTFLGDSWVVTKINNETVLKLDGNDVKKKARIAPGSVHTLEINEYVFNLEVSQAGTIPLAEYVQQFPIQLRMMNIEMKVLPAIATRQGVDFGTRIGVSLILRQGDIPIEVWLGFYRVLGRRPDGSPIGEVVKIPSHTSRNSNVVYTSGDEFIVKTLSRQNERILFTSDEFGNIPPGIFVVRCVFMKDGRQIGERRERIRIKPVAGHGAEVMKLTPANSVRVDADFRPTERAPTPITFVRDYVNSDESAILVGNDRRNHIVLVSSFQDEQGLHGMSIPQAIIQWVEGRGFVIVGTAKTELRLNGRVVEAIEGAHGLEGSHGIHGMSEPAPSMILITPDVKFIHINDYVFSAELIPNATKPTFEEFRAQFEQLWLLIGGRPLEEPHGTDGPHGTEGPHGSEGPHGQTETNVHGQAHGQDIHGQVHGEETGLPHGTPHMDVHGSDVRGQGAEESLGDVHGMIDDLNQMLGRQPKQVKVNTRTRSKRKSRRGGRINRRH